MSVSENEARQLVRRRSLGFCEARVFPGCRGQATSVHHLTKRSHGGAWCAANLVNVCGHGTVGCHGWIEANPAAAHELGLSRRTGEDIDTPVRISFRGLSGVWRLHCDGSITWLHD